MHAPLYLGSVQGGLSMPILDILFMGVGGDHSSPQSQRCRPIKPMGPVQAHAATKVGYEYKGVQYP
jgi:hypothetical protein